MPSSGPVTPADRLLDPEERVQQARDFAWRQLSQRDRTEAEIAQHLAAKRVEPAVIEQVLAELKEGAYVDDARFAQRFTEDQRSLQEWGPDRIERRLLALGIDRDHIAAALAARGHEEELDAAVALLVRRVGSPPESLRDRDRALGILVRKGFPLDLAHDALRRFAGAPLD